MPRNLCVLGPRGLRLWTVPEQHDHPSSTPHTKCRRKGEAFQTKNWCKCGIFRVFNPIQQGIKLRDSFCLRHFFNFVEKLSKDIFFEQTWTFYILFAMLKYIFWILTLNTEKVPLKIWTIYSTGIGMLVRVKTLYLWTKGRRQISLHSCIHINVFFILIFA